MITRKLTRREAILAAADHIEAHPEEFSYLASAIPTGPGCGRPSCALGWIAYFRGMSAGSRHLNDMTREALGLGRYAFPPGPAPSFVSRMQKAAHGLLWRENAGACAQTLRNYADMFHPLRRRAE